MQIGGCQGLESVCVWEVGGMWSGEYGMLSEYRVSFWGEDNVWNYLEVVVARHCEYTKCH